MSYVDEVYDYVVAKNPAQPEFHQAVKEVLESLRVVIEANEEEYRKHLDDNGKFKYSDFKIRGNEGVPSFEEIRRIRERARQRAAQREAEKNGLAVNDDKHEVN